MQYFSNNLTFLRKNLNKKQSEVADELNIGRSRYANYEGGHSNPDVSTLLKLADYYKSSIDSLVKKDLSNYLNDENSEDYLNESSVEYKKLPPKKFGIPLIPATAKAGKNMFDIQIMDYDIVEYFDIPGLKEKADFVFQIDGDSMYPYYEDKSYVICKKIEISELRWEKAYLITVDHAPMLKMLLPSTTKGNVLCRSFNTKYHSDFEVKKNDINSIAKILAVVRLVN